MAKLLSTASSLLLPFLLASIGSGSKSVRAVLLRKRYTAAAACWYRRSSETRAGHHHDPHGPHPGRWRIVDMGEDTLSGIEHSVSRAAVTSSRLAANRGSARRC